MRLLALILLLIPLLALADAPADAGRQERGWFYYEPIPAPKEPEPPPPPPPPSGGPPASADTVPLSSAWLRKNLPVYLDRAIDQPTLDNVRRYRYLERLAMDRSSAYSDTSARLTLLDPLLDEQRVSPLTAVAKATRSREIEADRRRILGRIAAESGLWFFFRSDCPYCHAQVAALEAIRNVHGFSVLPISVDHLPLVNGAFPNFVRDQGHAAKLGVQVTPALYLVNRDGSVLPLATGLQTMDQLEYRITELGHALGWISDEDMDRIRPLQNTDFDNLVADLDPTGSPDALIDQLIARGAHLTGQSTPIQGAEAQTP